MKENYLKKELYELIRSEPAVFDFLQNAALDGFWYWDLENPDEEWMNPKFWHTLGYDPNEMPHKASAWQDIIFSEDLAAAKAKVKEHLDNPDIPYDQVVRYRHKKGHTVWIRCRGMAIRDESGRPIRMLGAHHDITAQKEAEISWKKEHATLQNILNKSSIYVIKTDMEGLYTYVNDYFCDRLGISREEALGKMSTDYIIPEDHGKCGETVERCLAEPGVVKEVILRKPHPDGGFFTNFWEFTAVTDENGVPYEFLCVGRDISDKQQAETAVQEFFTNSYDLLSVRNFRGEFEEVNQRWSERTGYSAEELHAKPYLDFVHPDDQAATRQAFEGMLEGQEKKNFQNRYRCKDGTYIWLEWSSVPDPATRSVYSVARDITQQKKQRELREKTTSSSLKFSKRATLHKSSFNELLQEVVAEAARVLEVSRFSVWMYQADETAIRCLYEYNKGAVKASQSVIERAQVPGYFRAFENRRVLAIEDARKDPRTAELTAYLNENQVKAVLDAQIYQGEKPCGIISGEHEAPRTWLYEEENYLSNLAEIVATAQLAQKERESEERYRSAVDALSEGLVVQDLNDNIITANKAAADILGLSMDQLLGKSSFDPQWQATHFDGRPLAPTEHPSVVTARTGEPVDNFLMNVQTGSGERRIISINSRPVRNDAGKMYGVVASFTDVTAEKNALHELRLSNKFLNLAQKTARTGHYRYFPQEDRWESSEALDEVFGIPADYPRDLEAWAGLMHPEDRQAMVAYFRDEVLGEEQPFDRRYRIVHQETGETRWVAGNGTLLKNEQGVVVELFGTIQDVTEQQQRERSLAEAREALQNTADNIPGMLYQYVFHTDGTDSIPFTSRGVENLFEVSQEKVAEDPSILWKYLHPEDIPKVQQSIKNSAATLNNWEAAFRLRMEDGRIKWVTGRGVPKRFPNGDIFWNSIALDITPQKRAEEQLKQSTAFLNSINQNLNEGIYRATEAGLTYANQAFARLFGYDSVAEVLAADTSSFYESKEQRARLQKNLKEKGMYNGEEVRFTRKDGSRFWASVNVMYSEDEQGRGVFDGAIRDITARKQAEEQLRQSEEQFRFLVEKINDVVVLWDKDFNYEYISPAVEHTFGYTMEEYKKFGVFDNIPKADHPKLLKAMEEMRQGTDNIELEHRVWRKDGKLIWLRNRTEVFRDKEGEITNVITTSSDITERKKTEQALAESEARYREIAETVPGAVLRYQRNPDGSYDMLFASQNAENIWEIPVEEIIIDPRTTWLMVREPFRKPIEELLKLSIRTLKEWSYEWQIETPSGKIKWLSGIGVPKQNEDGGIVWNTLFLDITRRKTMEAEVRRLADVAERTADVILTCDEEGIITWCNVAIREVLGFEPEDIIGHKPTAKLTGAETNMELVRELEACLIRKKVFNKTLRLYRHDGTPCWINYETTPIYNKTGNFLYSIVVKRDLTDLITKQEELKELLQTTTEQNKRLKEFSYITSHNIRSSVANLLGLTELLNTEPGNPKYVEMVNRSTRRLDKTIKNINALLQVEQGTKPLEKETVSLHEAVERALEQNTRLIDEQNAQVEQEVPEDIQLFTIPVYLDSIIQNLITNALKYGITFVSKKVEVRGYRQNGEVALEVQDYGHGIDMKKDGHRLFQLGTRLHDISGGQGLGLYMSKRQAEALGGRIEVESEMNKGTTFRLCLPDRGPG